MTSFNKKWVPERKQSIREEIRDSIFPSGPLKNRIEETQRALQSQISKLDARASKIQEKDSNLFSEVVASVQKHDNEHATSYSSELAETRKMKRTVTQTKMVLEQISLKLNTMKDVGDIAATLSPVVPVVKGMRSSLTDILPDTSSELGEIGNMLSGIVSDAGHLNGLTMSFSPTSEEAEKILAEAATLAEKKASEKIPDLTVPTNESIGLPTADSNL